MKRSHHTTHPTKRFVYFFNLRLAAQVRLAYIESRRAELHDAHGAATQDSHAVSIPVIDWGFPGGSATVSVMVAMQHGAIERTASHTPTHHTCRITHHDVEWPEASQVSNAPSHPTTHPCLLKCRFTHRVHIQSQIHSAAQTPARQRGRLSAFPQAPQIRIRRGHGTCSRVRPRSSEEEDARQAHPKLESFGIVSTKSFIV